MNKWHDLWLEQAVDAAVAAAVLDATEKAVNKTKAEVEAVQAAQKAAADTQAIRELEDKCEALQQQVASLQDTSLAAEASLRSAPATSFPTSFRAILYWLERPRFAQYCSPNCSALDRAEPSEQGFELGVLWRHCWGYARRA